MEARWRELADELGPAKILLVRDAAGRPRRCSAWPWSAAMTLLVVGTRGTGLSKVLLGSTATELAAHAKVPVLLGGGSASA